MDKAKEAAINLRKIWQAHDAYDAIMGTTAAAALYTILGGDSSRAHHAGYLTMEAYFAADEAEIYHGKDHDKEDFYYDKARKFLEDARTEVGLEAESPKYTVVWWKAYKHKDKRGIINGLVEEHKAQFISLGEVQKEAYANKCAQKLIDAATGGHDKKDWEAMDNALGEYFEIYFEALGKFDA